MKRKILLTTTVLTLTCLMGWNQLSHIKETDDQKVNLLDNQQKGLILPQIEGVNIVSDKLEPMANELVKLTISPKDPLSKRINEVRVNNKIIKGQKSLEDDTISYEFKMPDNDVAIVDVFAVDLHKILIDESVKDSLSIYGVENNVAAENEVVEFRPVSYAGYYFKQVEAIDDDVEITPVEGKSNWYKFTMPSHDVTLTSVVGKNIYQLSFADNFVVEGETKEVIWNLDTESEVKDGKYYEYGKELSFKIDSVSNKYKIGNTYLDDTLLTLNEEDGKYHFTMPSYDAKINFTYDLWYRNLTLNDLSDNLSFSLKTLVDDEEKDVTDNNLVAGNEVRIYVTNDVANPHFLPTFAFKGKNSDDEEFKNINVSVTEPSLDKDYYSFIVPTYDEIDLTLQDRYGVIEEDAIYGEYEGGYNLNSSSNASASVTSNFKFRSSSYSSYEDKGLIEFVNQGDYSSLKTSTNQIFYDGVDTLFTFDLNAPQLANIKLFSKGHNNFSSSNSFAYYVSSETNTNNVSKLFIHAEFSDQTVKELYFDFETLTIYWDANYSLVSGTNGSTVGDVLEITTEDNTLLSVFEIETKGSSYSGSAHKVKSYVIDEYRGTYLPSEGESETDNLFINGYGELTIGENKYSYTLEDNLLITFVNDETRYYLLNKEDFTYSRSDDQLSGTYQFNSDEGNKTLILDGKGNATLDEVQGTYIRLAKDKIALKVENQTYYVKLDTSLNTFEFKIIDQLYEWVESSTEYTFDNENGVLKSNNYHQNSSSAEIGIRALENVTISFTYNVSSEGSYTIYDYLTIKRNDEVILTKLGGKQGTGDVDYSIELQAGDTLTFIYSKDSSGDGGDDCALIKNLKIYGISIL